MLLEQDLNFYRPIRFPGDVETETKPGLTLLRLQSVRQVFKEFSDPTRNTDWKSQLKETPDAIEESFA